MSVSQIREYAEMQRNRGRAYSLMKAGDKQANLKRAIACYEKALQVYTREQYPKEWTALHYDIGNTYQNLPASASEKSANLQEAITHYENALQVHILHDERWAIIHFRLGEAYYHLTSGDRQANLNGAIAAYMRSLEVYTRKAFPAQWAMIYLCIGDALRKLPSGEQSAFMYYQDALQIYTRQTFPRQWAVAQRSLGDLFFSARYDLRPRSPSSAPTMGSSESDNMPNLRDAILCYQGALQVYTREEYPVEWAATLYALGNSYRSVRGDDQQTSLEEAVDCYRQVLQVYTLEAAPLEWARTQWGLGDAYMSVARDKGSSAHKLASACYEQALKVYTQIDFSREWSELQKNLQAARDEQIKARMEEANASRSAGDVQFSRREYQSALKSYQEALRLYQQLGKRNEEAQIHYSIGEVQLARDKNHRKDAEQNYLFALSSFQQAGNVAGEAAALRGLGEIDQITAQESYQQATELLQREPHSPQIQQLLSTGDTKRETARQNYEQALTLYLKAGDNASADRTRQVLNEVDKLGEQRNAMQHRIFDLTTSSTHFDSTSSSYPSSAFSSSSIRSNPPSYMPNYSTGNVPMPPSQTQRSNADLASTPPAIQFVTPEISTNPPTYPLSGSSALLPYPTGNVPMPPSQTQWSSQAVAPPPPASQFGSAQALGSLRHAFAGHGRLIMHHSWLLPGDQAQAMAVRHVVQTKIRQRSISRLTINPGALTERGVLMEEREYLIAQRGVTTVFIYAAPAGSDLYISRATTVLPTVSNIRIIISLMLAIIMFIGFFDHPSALSSLTELLTGFLDFLSILIVIFFIVMLVLSFISWILEKDFLRYLRPNILNNFQIDDIMLLEQVTDDVVYSAVEQLGLDASKIAPPLQGYQPKQRIRAI